MNKKSLLAVVGLALIALAAVLAISCFKSRQNEAKLQGKLVFARTYDLGDEVDRIVITTADDVIELKQKKSFWLVSKQDEYFADFKLINQFLDALNHSVYVISLPESKNILQENYLLNPQEHKKDSGMLIQTFIADEMLDEMIVGLPDAEEKYFFAKQPQDDRVWLIDGNFNLPLVSGYWLPSPVVSMPKEQVESIKIDNDWAQRKGKSKYFVNNLGKNINVEALLNVLAAIYIDEAKNTENFYGKGLDKLPSKKIEVVTLYGLKFVCQLYYDKKDVWLNIKLTTTPLPMSTINDYIKGNSFLYDGWYFRISPRQGHILRDFRLI